MGTGSKQSITITNSGNLNREDIERMVREAEMNQDADRKAQELVEARNESEQLIYSTEKALREAGDTVEEALRTSVNEKIEALRTAIKGEDQTEIMRLKADLEAESHQVSEILYKKVSEQADESEKVGAATGAGPKEDVQEAQFKED
jgi:molecular chaperone DnaK